MREEDDALLHVVLVEARWCAARGVPALPPLLTPARAVLVAGKIFAICDPKKRKCYEMHVAAPESDQHSYRYAHGRRKKKPRTTGPKVGRPPAPRSASAANSTPAAPTPGPRQQQGASSAWDERRYGGKARRRSSGEERGSSAEDDDDDDDDDDDSDDDSNSNPGR